MSARASLLAFLAACVSLVPVASAQTFTGGPIAINELGPATPYPSVINVQNPSLASQSSPPFIVTLHGFTHTFAADVFAVLQAPSGQLFTLMGRCGGQGPANNIDLSFTGTATSTPPAPLVTGTYLPGNCGLFHGFPPLPNMQYGTDLTSVNGAACVGEWKLFVGDVFQVDAGSIASWSITFPELQVDPQSSTAFTYQGSLSENGVPFNGPAQLRFALMNAETGGAQIGPRVVANVNVGNGLFTTLLDYGANAFPPDQPRFLQIFNGPTPLSPRQRVSPAPRAVKADVASRADISDVAARAVCIANSAGASALFASGNSVVSNFMLISPEFRFNGPNFGSRSLHPSAFTPATSSMTYTRDAGGLYSNTPGAFVSFAAPLDVPSFANLTSVDLTVAYAGGSPISLTLVRVLHGTGEQEVLGNTLVTTPSATPQLVSVGPESFPAIDNNTHSYAVVASWTTPIPASATRILSARVRYTVEYVPR